MVLIFNVCATIKDEVQATVQCFYTPIFKYRLDIVKIN